MDKQNGVFLCVLYYISTKNFVLATQAFTLSCQDIK